MTCTPTITIKKGSWDTQDAGLFGKSTSTVVLIVDYCESIAEGCTEANWPDRGGAVVAAIGYYPNNLWDIRIGRALMYYDSATSAWSPWIETYTADLTATEIAASPSTKAPWVVENVSARQVNAGHKGLWEVTISISSMAIQSTGQYPNASIDVTTNSRSVRAYRGGSGLLVPTTNSTTSGPKIGVAAANGFFNPSGWRDGLKATMDCAGGRLDVNAQPVTIAIEQNRFAISFILRKPWIDFDPTSNLVFSNAMWTKWAINGYKTLNKRNKDVLFGFEIGELVCDGVNISSLDAQFSRCELSFVWDEWGHFDQSAWGIDGTVPDLNDDPLQSASPDRPVLVAETVFWTTSYHESFELATTDLPRDVWDIASVAITP
tara:strand:- start:3470 stop:4597 length:1128 start_codon:yes stop_codon:yes gene_type:complete